MRRFLVRSSGCLAEGALTWESPIRLWAAAVHQLRCVFRWLASGGPFQVWESADLLLGVGVSDAAGGAGCGGYIFRQGRLMIAVRMMLRDEHINAR